MRLVYVVALALASCLPEAKGPPECQEAPLDESIAAVLAECQVDVATAPNATEKARIRKSCLERLNALEEHCK